MINKINNASYSRFQIAGNMRKWNSMIVVQGEMKNKKKRMNMRSERDQLERKKKVRELHNYRK